MIYPEARKSRARDQIPSLPLLNGSRNVLPHVQVGIVGNKEYILTLSIIPNHVPFLICVQYIFSLGR